MKNAKRDIEILKKQLEVKEKSVANYRADTTKLRRDNFELKRQILVLKTKMPANTSTENEGNNDLQAAREMARARRRAHQGMDAEAAIMA